MKQQHHDVTFEPRLGSDGRTWQMMVTWQHSLRDNIDGLIFCSEKLADHWIQTQSLQWVKAESRRLAMNAPRRSTSEKSRPKKLHRRALRPSSVFTSNKVPALRLPQLQSRKRRARERHHAVAGRNRPAAIQA